MYQLPSTVEPPNKGHFGANINSDVVSFVERLSSLRRFKKYVKQIFGTLTCVLCIERSIILCPYLSEVPLYSGAMINILCIAIYQAVVE